MVGLANNCGGRGMNNSHELLQCGTCSGSKPLNCTLSGGPPNYLHSNAELRSNEALQKQPATGLKFTIAWNYSIQATQNSRPLGYQNYPYQHELALQKCLLLGFSWPFAMIFHGLTMIQTAIFSAVRFCRQIFLYCALSHFNTRWAPHPLSTTFDFAHQSTTSLWSCDISLP